MSIKKLQEQWDTLGRIDPLWATLSRPDKKGNKWDHKEFFGTGEQELNEIIQYLKSLAVTLKRKRTLDFGCGIGRVTRAMGTYYDEVHGVDIAPSMIALAKKHNRQVKNCTFHLNKVSNLRLFPSKSFDFVYSSRTLQHMKPRYAKEYIREFLRILVPGGVLVFQLPSEYDASKINEHSSEALSQKVKQFLKTNWQLSKDRIKSVTPSHLLPLFRARYSFYRTLYKTVPLKKGFLIESYIKMYGIERKVVEELIKESGGCVLDVKEDQAGGPGWTSFRYCAVRK